MKKLIALASLCMATTFFYSSSASALGYPHFDGLGITCADCHAMHGGAGPAAPTGAAQEALCKSCHNPTGLASGMSDVERHIVADGNSRVDCAACHEPHAPQTSTDAHTGGATAENLSLIRAQMNKLMPPAQDPTVFQTRPDHFAFTSAPYNGVCQTCHLGTNYWRNDGTGAAHNVGADCIDCHSHKEGFVPTACVGCHSAPIDNGDGVPVGGRRGVVGEFPSAVHGHMNGEQVADTDCLVCHAITTHKNGEIELIDPDDSSIYTFVKAADLTSDPDVSDFCSHCHDEDGATRLTTPLDPFGSGRPVPDVASNFKGSLQWVEWYGDICNGPEGTRRGVTSHHDISDSDQAFSGAKLECLNCHGAHTPSENQVLADPDNTLQPWTGSNNGFCIRCHSGGNGPDDVGMPASVVGPTILVNDLNGDPCNPGDTDCNTTTAGLRPMESCRYQNSPWYTSYTFSNEAHGGDSKRAWASYFPTNGTTCGVDLDCVLALGPDWLCNTTSGTCYGAAPVYAMECQECHDAHGSYTATNTVGNPYMIRDQVEGAKFVDDGRRGAFTGPPWNVFGTTRDVVVGITEGTNPPPLGEDYSTVDWGGYQVGGADDGLCNACHGSWLPAMWAHDMCSGCQTCHGHGQDWGAADLGGGPDNSTGCWLCGNGVLDNREACDDGKQCNDGSDCTSNGACPTECATRNGDGCDTQCKVE
ncbi:MAG: hypothetical protein AUK47_27640 [Deltaproteobacteria bacterium CG2_30_63_29]|nr:MAG: hypothetical protein AUK47_27640 [Deltaproteobacteria bacterium CG2_30_63_29]